MSLYVLSECCQRLSLAAESEGASGLVLPHHESKSMYMYMCMCTCMYTLYCVYMYVLPGANVLLM